MRALGPPEGVPEERETPGTHQRATVRKKSQTFVLCLALRTPQACGEAVPLPPLGARQRPCGHPHFSQRTSQGPTCLGKDHTWGPSEKKDHPPWPAGWPGRAGPFTGSGHSSGPAKTLSLPQLPTPRPAILGSHGHWALPSGSLCPSQAQLLPAPAQTTISE